MGFGTPVNLDPIIANLLPTSFNTTTFDKPVQGAGTQIAVADTPSFTGFLSAFDHRNNLLGSFSITGTSGTVIDNYAVFLGVKSDSANISKLVYSSSENNRAFGVNFLSIQSTSVPASDNMVALSVLGIGVLATRKKILRSYN